MSISTINLGSMLRRTSHKFPNRLALVSHGGKEITYGRLEHLSNRFANGLIRLGAGKGDHIATLFRNGMELVIALFGILKMGGTAVLLNARLSEREIEWVLNHSDSTIMIFSNDFLDMVSRLQPRLEKVNHYIIAGDNNPDGTIGYDQMLQQGVDKPPPVDIVGDDKAFLIYTAGTTGKPKGVMLTHNSSLWNCVNWYEAGVYRPDDRSLQVLPIYHVAALGSVLTYIYIGGTCYLKKHFDPEDVMETIQREKITRWMAAPTVFNMILQLPDVDTYDTSSLTLLGSGAAIIPGDTRSGILKVFPNARFFDTYGMTEASGGVTTLSPQHATSKAGSVGRAYITEELRVVDEDDQDMEPGETGEIIFRGNNLMKGYYKDPEMTSKVLRGGWMHTGDLGYLDEDGFVYISGRAEDLIITGGENVYPKEVEEWLYAHPGISEAAVIGVEDAKWGEAIQAVIVPQPGVTLSEEEIISFCRQKIARYKCPKSVTILKELPKNAAGKIMKKDLKKRYRIMTS